MNKIDVKSLRLNPFTAIGEDWLLLTAGNRDNANTMTASWGGMGVLWGKNVVTVYVRPQRFTYQFMEQSDYFTIAFFDESWRDALKLCGSKSGREVDKVNECGFSLAYGVGDAPYFQEAKLVLVCKKIYFDDIEPDHFLDPETDGKNYPKKDYHRMYIGEIMEVYQN